MRVSGNIDISKLTVMVQLKVLILINLVNNGAISRLVTGGLNGSIMLIHAYSKSSA